MKVSKSNLPNNLRKRAEKKIPKSIDEMDEMRAQDVKKLIHELNVRQIELEMQNEELRDSQLAAEKAHNKFADLYDFAPIGYFTLDKDGFIIEANLTGAALLGFERRNLINVKQPFHRFIIGQHFDIFQTHLNRAFASQSKQTCRLKIISRDIHTLDAMIVITASRDSEGQFEHYLCAVSDITEMAKIEEELRGSEERYKELVENANSMIIRMNQSGEITFFNEYAQKFFGYSPDEILRQDVKILLPKIETGSGRKMEKMADAILRNPDDFVENINENVRKNGERVWISWRNKAIKDSKGNIVGNLAIGQDITEYKRAEEALRKSEEKYRNLVQYAPAAIYEIDMVGTKFLSVNDVMCEVTGYSREELMAMPPADLVSEEGKVLFGERIRKTLAGEKIDETVEYRVRKKNGQWIDVAVSVGSISETTGNIPSVLVIARDITERKKAEEALRQEHDFISAVLDTEGALVVVLDRQGRITRFNRACEYTTGYSAAEVQGRIFWELLVPPDELAGVKSIWEELSAGTFPNEHENYWIAKDGTRRFIAWSNSALVGENGDIQYIIGTGIDITERNQAEEALRLLTIELERKIDERTTELRTAFFYARNLLEASLDPLVTINPEGKITDVNKATEQVTGYTREELIGTDFSDYFTDPKAARVGYQQVFVQEHVRDYPLAVRHKSGSTIDVLYNATIYHNEEGKVMGVFAAARDITRRKQAEAAIREANEMLERRVAERTAELESFSYSISHDLRAPLRAIDGFSRMILRTEGDQFKEETLRKFMVIRDNVQKMGELIDDLLEFSRLGRKEINIGKLNITDLTRNAWNELQVINPDRNIRITINDMPVGYGDRTLIKQVLTNLLSNAIKFTQYKDVAHIEVGGYESRSNGIYYIKDNGVGFDMIYYDKLFGVFQRLHSADEFEGTGVGLAIVQRIIHGHNGRVGAEGKVNEGATFYFSLPERKE